MILSQELQARGFIHQFSAERLEDILDKGSRVVYHGIDPSADSAHAGNFVNWMLLRHLRNAGHKIIFLVGGGTGLIGDPKVDKERQLSDPEVVANNVAKLRAQAERFVGEDVIFVNNAEWLTKLELIPFLRDIGKQFTINELIKKEAIALRLNGEQGISYTEFAYPLLQAYDYLALNRQFGCDVQVGGSDQWGNMVAGIDLIRRQEKKTAHVVTVPLIIDKTTGKKFGKSEGNAVWLDPEKTSPYQFYQFWLNATDDNVIDYLKLFTLRSLAEIAELDQSAQSDPGARKAQRVLAHEVTALVHGEEIANRCVRAAEILFSDQPLGALDEAMVQMLLNNAPTETVALGETLVEVLVRANLATSKREARTFIESGAVSLNGEKVKSTEELITETHFMNGVALLKRGKRQLCILTQQ